MPKHFLSENKSFVYADICGYGRHIEIAIAATSKVTFATQATFWELLYLLSPKYKTNF